MWLYTKLLEIQKLHLEFEKDTTNPFFKSKYVSLDSIVSKLTPHLDKQWLLVIHFTKNNEIYTQVIDSESEDGSDFIESQFPLVQSPDPQKLGSCITYAKRYNLWQLFNIVTDWDDDGNEASEVEKKKETVDTASGWTKPKTPVSTNEYCPECWEHCNTKKWTTKDWRAYEMWECNWCDLKFFVNRK